MKKVKGKIYFNIFMVILAALIVILEVVIIPSATWLKNKLEKI